MAEKETTSKQRQAAAHAREQAVVAKIDDEKARARRTQVETQRKAYARLTRSAASLTPLDARQEVVGPLSDQGNRSLIVMLHAATSAKENGLWLSPNEKMSNDWLQRAYAMALQAGMICYPDWPHSVLRFGSGGHIDFSWPDKRQ